MRSKDILNKAGFSDLQTRREQQLAVVMYKIKHKMLPNYLQDIFVNTQQAIIITRDQRRLDKQAAKHHGYQCLIARVTSLILWLLWSEHL